MPSSVSPNSGSTGFSPVAAANTTSPSSGACTGIDRARHTGLRHHGETLGLRLGQHGVGHDHDQRGVFRRRSLRAALEPHGQHVRRERRRQSASAEFAVRLERRRPEPRPVADVTLPTALTTASAPTVTPPSVCAEAEPRPPLKLTVVAPIPAPTLPSAKSPPAAARRGIAEIAIGREAAPRLVAAVEQIEADRAAARSAPPPRGPESRGPVRQPGLHAARGIEAERRAAGERDRVDRLDRLGIEQALSRVPGPPPRTSIDGTAGLSKRCGDAGGELWRRRHGRRGRRQYR